MVMQIETTRLILRDYRPEDWERVHIYGSQPEFSRFELWGPNSVEDTKKFVDSVVAEAKIAPRFKFNLAVCLKDGLLIGGNGIRRESQNSCVANLGWAINPEFQNRGYASEAAAGLIKFGFESLNLRVIYATCDARNSASFKVMEKVGMKRVGLLEKNLMQKGHMRDSLRYEICRT